MNKKLTLSIVACTLFATNLLSNENLDNIVITSATKSEQSIKDVTSNVEVITKEEIEERSYLSVSEALNSISGLNIVSNGGLGQSDSLFIRGVSAKRVLILIDGVRYNEPAGLSGAPLAQLNMADIERIEIVKGAQSGIWGADASGGVVNIITKNYKQGFHGNVGLEYGSFNTKRYLATISNKTDNYYIKLNANKVDTDGYSATEPKKGTANYGKRGKDLGLEKDGYTNSTYSLSGGVYINSENEINVQYKKINAKYDYDTSAGTDGDTQESELKHNFKNINYKYSSDNYKLKLSAQQSNFDRTQGTFNAKSLVNEFSLESNINYDKDSNLIVGLNKQNFKDTNNKYKYHTNALFASNKNKFDDLIFSQTLRYDDNSKFDEKVTGKLGIKYNFTKDSSLYGNYGTAYNAPTLSNLNYTPTLKPETTKSMDLNVKYKGLRLTYFKTQIKDMIDWNDPDGWQGPIAGGYINADGESVFKGYEVVYSNNVTLNTLLTINYTKLSAKDSDDKDLARRADSMANLLIDYYGIKKTHLSLNGSYVGERYDSADKQGAQTGKYTIWKAVINYDIDKKTKVYLKVDNLFNKYYQTVDGYATAARSAYAGIKVKF